MHAQEDVSPRLGRVIWLYFIGLALSLYVIIAALSVYFEMRLEKEKTEKVGMVESVELINQRDVEHAILSGELVKDNTKKNIPIDDAIDMYVAQLRAQKGSRQP